MKELLAYRVYDGEKPVGAFPTLREADRYAKTIIDHNIGRITKHLRNTSVFIERYAPSENVACPMIRYKLGPNGIVRCGYSGEAPINAVDFYQICRQMASIDGEVWDDQLARRTRMLAETDLITPYSHVFASYDGCIWEDNHRLLDAPEADRIAQRNGYQYAEQLVQAFAGKTFKTDDNLKIIDPEPPASREQVYGGPVDR